MATPQTILSNLTGFTSAHRKNDQNRERWQKTEIPNLLEVFDVNSPCRVFTATLTL